MSSADSMFGSNDILVLNRLSKIKCREHDLCYWNIRAMAVTLGLTVISTNYISIVTDCHERQSYGLNAAYDAITERVYKGVMKKGPIFVENQTHPNMVGMFVPKLSPTMATHYNEMMVRLGRRVGIDKPILFEFESLEKIYWELEKKMAFLPYNQRYHGFLYHEQHSVVWDHNKMPYETMFTFRNAYGKATWCMYPWCVNSDGVRFLVLPDQKKILLFVNQKSMNRIALELSRGVISPIFVEDYYEFRNDRHLVGTTHMDGMYFTYKYLYEGKGLYGSPTVNLNLSYHSSDREQVSLYKDERRVII